VAFLADASARYGAAPEHVSPGFAGKIFARGAIAAPY
jgi:hypothetical protein